MGRLLNSYFQIGQICSVNVGGGWGIDKTNHTSAVCNTVLYGFPSSFWCRPPTQGFPYMMGSLNGLYAALTLQRRMTTVVIKQANKRAAIMEEQKVQCLSWILQRSLHILVDTCCIPSGFSGMCLAAMLRAVCHTVWASWWRTQVLFCTASFPLFLFLLSRKEVCESWAEF